MASCSFCAPHAPFGAPWGLVVHKLDSVYWSCQKVGHPLPGSYEFPVRDEEVACMMQIRHGRPHAAGSKIGKIGYRAWNDRYAVKYVGLDAKGWSERSREGNREQAEGNKQPVLGARFGFVGLGEFVWGIWIARFSWSHESFAISNWSWRIWYIVPLTSSRACFWEKAEHR